MDRRILIKYAVGFILASLIPVPLFAGKRKHYIGLGGAGCTVLELLREQGMEGEYTFISNAAPTFISDNNFKSISRPDLKMQQDWSLEYELDPAPITTKMKKIFRQKSQYVLVAGLGNYTGTNLTYKLHNYLTEQNISFDVYCCTPFAFEGSKRNNFAQKIVKQLGSMPNFHSYSNESLRFEHGNLKMKEAFKKSDEELCHAINSI